MQEQHTPPPTPVSERDLDEVLRSLEVELFPLPRKRELADPEATAEA